VKLLFPAIIVLLLATWWLWNSSLARLWRKMEARPASHFPVWRRAKERLDHAAHQDRLRRAPHLWILPEFAPNALVVRKGGVVHVALTEGLLRSLSDDELDAVLSLCLSHGASPRRRLQTALALQLFPFARLLQGYPPAIQIFLAPWLSAALRVVSAPSKVFEADKRVREPLIVAAALQKAAVLGRKIPLRHWNFALDPLFLLSPLALDGGPFWVFLSQPSVEERRRALLS
jgi:Zn-dependent protease with chaperone function